MIMTHTLSFSLLVVPVVLFFEFFLRVIVSMSALMNTKRGIPESETCPHLKCFGFGLKQKSMSARYNKKLKKTLIVSKFTEMHYL